MIAKPVEEMKRYADIYGLQLAEQQILTAMAEGHSSVAFNGLPESAKTALSKAGYKVELNYELVNVSWNSSQASVEPELHADGAK